MIKSLAGTKELRVITETVLDCPYASVIIIDFNDDLLIISILLMLILLNMMKKDLFLQF